MGELWAEIERMERALALPPFTDQPKSEATALLTVSRQELRGMSAQDCQEAAILLAQLSHHIQRQENRYRAAQESCQANLAMVIADTVGVQRGSSFEERKVLAIKHDRTAMELKRLEVEYQTRVTALSYQAMRIEYYSRLFSEQAKLKDRQHG